MFGQAGTKHRKCPSGVLCRGKKRKTQCWINLYNEDMLAMCCWCSFAVLLSHLPAGCCGIQDYESLSGDCAHTSQSAVDRKNQRGRRSEGMMGVSAADSLNRRCVGRSPGTLSSPGTQTYRAGKFRFLLNMQHEKILKQKHLFFSFSHLAEQISEGLAWQYSLVHSGWQLSGSKDSITAQSTF